jgi:sec-independent protein translocase protein TatA
MMMGGWEILVILCIILVLFGGKRLPELARNLGKGINEFKKASQNISDEINRPPSTSTTPPPTEPELAKIEGDTTVSGSGSSRVTTTTTIKK